jgi:hypothetical protein
MSKNAKPEATTEAKAEVEKVLKPFFFPEREVSILAETLEEATAIYNSRYQSNA